MFSCKYFICAVVMLLVSRPVWAEDAPGGDQMHMRQAGVLHIYTVGKIEPDQWKHLSDEQQKADVQGLKEFAQKGLDNAHEHMALLETPHFLIYGDVTPDLMQEEAGLLEISYKTLVGFFNISSSSAKAKEKPQGPNVWRGKALVFLFRDVDRYQKVMPSIHPQTLEPVAVVLNGNGSVDIDMPSVESHHDKRVMILTMVEAFLYRYRTPTTLPNWIIDGLSASLADTTHIGNETPESGKLYDSMGLPTLDCRSRDYLKHHELDGIINGSNNDPYTDVICDSMATYMVRINRARYPQFINALKDGMSFDDAIEKKYGASLDRVKNGYLDYLSRLR